MKFVKINNLLWCALNLSGLLTFEEAQAEAAKLGLRLPTIVEFSQLLAHSYWSKRRKGRVCGRSHWWQFWKSAVFLPAAGYRNITGALIDQDTCGRYWLSEQKNATNGWYWYFDSNNNFGHTLNKAIGFSVRCVKDIAA